jgi:hypothetical protein
MNKNILKKTFKTSTSLFLIFAIIYIMAEPTVSTAADTKTDQVVVTLTVDAGVSITSPADVTMSQVIGLSADTAVGNAAWTVKTNNYTGYSLNVHASTTPALKSASDEILDYTEATPNTPEFWSVPANNVEFGFSAYGADVATVGGNPWNGASDTDCIGASAHVPSPTLKYMGFKGSTDKLIAYKSSETLTTGVITNICFAVEQDTIYAPSGVYTATVTATAITN